MLIDTHCHFSGCLSTEFLWQAINTTQQHYLAETYDDVLAATCFRPTEPRNFDQFLSKFNIVNNIHWTEKLIELAVQDVASVLNQADYTLLSLSLDKYLNSIGWHKTECVNFISSCLDAYAPNKVGLLLALKYEYPRTTIKQHMALADDPIMYETFCGVDFVGNERMLDAELIKSLIDKWKGKIIRIHVGEVEASHDVTNVIESLDITRIAHGVSADERCRKIIKERQLPVDMCLSSNYFTGRIDEFSTHPIKQFMDEGLIVTIGSDDPTQFNTTLVKEYRLAEKSNLDVSQLKRNASLVYPKRQAE